LKTIIKNGFAPLLNHYHEWTAENLLWEYERILNSVFAKRLHPPTVKRGIVGSLRSKGNRFLSIPDSTFTWLKNSKTATEDDLHVDRCVQYRPVQIPANDSLNRILDDRARQLYSPAIEKLTALVPKTMCSKIS